VGNAQLAGELPPGLSGLADLPIEIVLPSLLAALDAEPNVVLMAPPGAGKTTRVPLALMAVAWLAGRKIIMLEPRRLAARAAAWRMADSLGEGVGQRVGYRTRLDSKVGPTGVIEVVTEGVLTRMIQADPALDGVGAILFDEFHERSLQADLGLALCLEAQAGLRPDLRLLVMSATLDGAGVASLMGGAPVIVGEGRSYPVEIRWLDKPHTGRFEDGMISLIGRALDDGPAGDILAFLPGQAEIRRLRTMIEDRYAEVFVAPLYGDLPREAQDAALAHDPRRRKVVLATAIAETSLTIDGVTAVVDGGLMRQARFDPNGGMTRLVTLPLAKSSAEQRAGRAGRTAPGCCYRLWTESQHRALPAAIEPEIIVADLAPLALDLARWGVTDPSRLAWLDRPPAAAFAQAVALLRDLDAVDEDGRITAVGRRMAELPLHPRLAHMVLKGAELGVGGLACDLAALLSERDVLRGERDPDLRLRLDALAGPPHSGADRGALQRVREAARQLRRRHGIAAGASAPAVAGLLVALAYPDRVALRRGASGLNYRLSNGRGAFLAEPGPLAAETCLAVADLDGEKQNARIFLAAPLTMAEIEEHFAARITTVEEVVWDSREQAVAARRVRRLGLLPLAETRLSQPPAGSVTAALLDGIRELTLDCLPWTDSARNLRQRIAFLHRLDGESWPDVSDPALLAELGDWLAPWLDGMSRRSHLDRLDLAAALSARLTWEQRQRLDREAPSHVTVPSGSRIAIDYSDSDRPVLAVRLQEMFGLAETPRVADGRMKLTLHLLSPARRPVQVTQDLASFWAGAYRQVKADLKGQYPKHYWPDDPLTAEPTARAKRRPS